MSTKAYQKLKGILVVHLSDYGYLVNVVLVNEVLSLLNWMNVS